MKKIVYASLILLCLCAILATISNHFDFDFGWHLEFGKNAETTGSFPYYDTHTYTFFGQNWTNHEWGNDLLVWQIYKNWGYRPLLIIITLVILGAFLLTQKIFATRLHSVHLIVTAILLWSMQHILVMRPAMYSLLFFAALWWTLENITKRPTYYLWPPLIWAWSALHGSWILAYIVIAIYILGNIINSLANKYQLQWYRPQQSWTRNTYINVFLWLILTSLLIGVNPYGIKIFQEVLGYFSPTYFKSHTTEWLPSYTYPVFWPSLIIIAPAAVLIFAAWRKKILTWPQLLLFVAFLYSGWQYKRNMMYFALICQPLFAAGLIWATETANPLVQKINRRVRLAISATFVLLVGLVIIFLIARIQLDRDVWQNHKLLSQYASSPAAIQFLKNTLPTNTTTKVFNEFSWGGCLIWEVPQALFFLDGRGTATWKLPGQDITALEFYQNLVYKQPDGLNWIEKSGAQYIILQRSNVGFYPPDKINKLLFSSADFKVQFDTTPSKLEQQIKNSPDWGLVYSDATALIWKKLSAR